jgi:hypothetical protein
MALGLLSAAAPLLVGCDSGPHTMRVWGEVTYQEQPVEYGSIVLAPQQTEGARTVGGSIVDGHYEIPAADGPIAGQTYRVEITGLKDEAAVETPQGGFTPRTNYIPAAFNVESQLKMSVAETSAGNQHDFQLPPVQ